MKKYLLILTVLSLSFYSCKDDDAFAPANSSPAEPSYSQGGEDDDEPIINVFKGKLLDPNNSPINNANVYLNNHPVYSYSTQTNSNGEFEILSVRKVAFDLVFSASGYLEETHSIDLSGVSGDTYDWGDEVLQLE